MPSWFFLASCGLLAVILVAAGLLVILRSPDEADSTVDASTSGAAGTGANTRDGNAGSANPASTDSGTSRSGGARAPESPDVIPTGGGQPAGAPGGANQGSGNKAGGKPSRVAYPNRSNPAEKLPGWVPVYAGIQPQGVYYGKGPNGTGGEYQFVTKDSLDNLVNYYRKQLEDAGYQVVLDDFKDSEEIKVKTLNGTSGGGKRTVNVMLSSQAGKVTVMVNFNDADGPALVDE